MERAKSLKNRVYSRHASASEPANPPMTVDMRQLLKGTKPSGRNRTGDAECSSDQLVSDAMYSAT